MTDDERRADVDGRGAVNQRAYRAAIVSFLVAIAGGIAAAIGYGIDNTGDLLGLGLAAALVGIGFGLVAGPSTSSSTSTSCRSASRCTITPVDRRRAARRDRDRRRDASAGAGSCSALFGGSFASLVVGFVGPIGSLGPKPSGERGRTSWRPGRAS